MKLAGPKSLLGQMLLLIGLALLLAQAVNFAFILNEQQKLSLAQNEGPAISRFVQAAVHTSANGETPPRPGRGASFTLAEEALIDRTGLERSPELERACRRRCGRRQRWTSAASTRLAAMAGRTGAGASDRSCCSRPRCRTASG